MDTVPKNTENGLALLLFVLVMLLKLSSVIALCSMHSESAEVHHEHTVEIHDKRLYATIYQTLS